MKVKIIGRCKADQKLCLPGAEENVKNDLAKELIERGLAEALGVTDRKPKEVGAEPEEGIDGSK